MYIKNELPVGNYKSVFLVKTHWSRPSSLLQNDQNVLLDHIVNMIKLRR